MLSHFNLKSLTFYGAMIGSVLLLFRVVSVYGENQLKAPPPISGTYQITATNFPNCVQNNKINLTVEQSGIYVLGTLLVTTQNETSNTEIKIPLSGKFQNDQFLLLGIVEDWASCSRLANQQNLNTIQINGKPEQQNIVGNISWNLSPEKIAFEAQKEITSNSEEAVH